MLSAYRLDRELAAVLPLILGDLGTLHRTGDYAWLEPLSVEERHDMRAELVCALRDALVSGDWADYDDTKHAWHETALILRDAALTRELLQERDPTRDVVLSRP